MKAGLLALVDHSRRLQTSFVEGLRPSEKAAQGSAAALSARDVIGHVAAWNEYIADALRSLRSGHDPEQPQAFMARNDERIQAQRQDSFEAVLARADTALSDLTASLEACEEADLAEPGRYAWAGPASVSVRVVLLAYIHGYGHFADYHARRQESDRAVGLHQAGVEEIAGGIGSGPELAFGLYNLAGAEAAAGRHDAAVDSLARAIGLLPAIGQFANSNPDLRLAREDPRIRSLTDSAMGSDSPS